MPLPLVIGDCEGDSNSNSNNFIIPQEIHMIAVSLYVYCWFSFSPSKSSVTVMVTAVGLYVYCMFFSPSISSDLQRLILRMLDKNPNTRITLGEVKVSSHSRRSK